MRKRPGLNSTAWMRIKLGSKHGEERETIILPNVSTSQHKVHSDSRNKSELPPQKPSDMSGIDHTQHTEKESSNTQRWRGRKKQTYA